MTIKQKNIVTAVVLVLVAFSIYVFAVMQALSK